jgi:hypothetical protein
MPARSASARRYRSLAIALVTTFAVALILLSPFAMTWMADLSPRWDSLADVGQAYGGTSAILSGLALSGISISLLMQRHQNRVALLHSIRQRQFDLVKLALDNNEYVYVDGAKAMEDPNSYLKVYANLFVGHWALLWDLGEIGEESLRSIAKRLFESPVARDWWETNGQSYRTSRSRRRLYEILSDECQRAAPSPALSSTSPHRPLNGVSLATSSRRDRRLVTGVALGMTIGVVLAPVALRAVQRFRQPGGRQPAR